MHATLIPSCSTGVSSTYCTKNGFGLFPILRWTIIYCLQLPAFRKQCLACASLVKPLSTIRLHMNRQYVLEV